MTKTQPNSADHGRDAPAADRPRVSSRATLALAGLLGVAACPGGGATTGEPIDTTSAADTTSDGATDTGTATGEPTSTGVADASTGTADASTGDASTGESTGATTGAPACEALADCEPGACRTAVACADGQCVFEDMPEGTALAGQVAGDCQVVVCDGRGGSGAQADPADLPDDAIDCTLDACDGPTPVHTPAAEACYGGPDGTLGVGVCAAGQRTCDVRLRDFGPCEGEVVPTLEDCDAGHLDEDCDGQVDEAGDACVCGDGYVSNLEPCDDGNPSDADACSSTCQLQEVLQVAHGSNHGCARLTGGRVKCWGAGNAGRLGYGDTITRGDGPGEMGAALPVVDLGKDQSAVLLAAASGSTCALLAGGRVKCWGYNQGALGLGDFSHRGDNPGEMGDALPFVDLGQGIVARRDLGGRGLRLRAAGRRRRQVLGSAVQHVCAARPRRHDDARRPAGRDGRRAAPRRPRPGPRRRRHRLRSPSLLRDPRRRLRQVLGLQPGRALGLGDTAKRGDQPGEMGDALPVVPLAADAAAVCGGETHSCVVLVDGRVQCWGGNGGGALGLGDAAHRGDQPGEMGPNLPVVDLGAGVLATAVACGYYHTCARLTDGSVKCWGVGFHGALGLGDLQDRGDGPGEMGDALPTVDLGVGLSAASLAASYAGLGVTCAALSDGSAKCWGANDTAQLGLGDTAVRGDMPGEMGDALPRIRLFSAVW